MAGVDPATYEAWYHAPRGRWIAEREFRLMMSMMRPPPGASLLDVGCGTGHFSRRFANAGLRVTGIDPDQRALEFAKQQGGAVDYRPGSALQLPFEDATFDYVSAVTSLCFISRPELALGEMWRVSTTGVMLGLLNRRSLLYRQRNEHPGYVDARWDTPADVRDWIERAGIKPASVVVKSAVTFPSGSPVSRLLENLVPARIPRGAFLALYLSR